MNSMYVYEQIWKPVPNWEGQYDVSNFGFIFSYKSNKILKAFSDRYGYQVVSLCNRGSDKLERVHRLVGIVFIPNPDKRPQINHKYGNKKQNAFHQLEWVTHNENMRHAVKTGLVKFQRGSKHQNHKLTEQEVIEIRYLYSEGWVSVPKLSEMYSIGTTTLYSIIRRRTWQHVP